MIVKCISTDLSFKQKELLPEVFKSSDFHITIGKEYLVFGVTISSVKNHPICLVQHISDYGDLISNPIALFDIIDNSVSKYWEIKVHTNGTITFWVPSFYKEFYHDDLSEGVPEIKKDFEIVKKKLEEELYPPGQTHS